MWPAVYDARVAAIDQYIGYLSKFKASAIVLESGKQVVVRLPTGDRAATATVSSSWQTCSARGTR